MPADPKTSAGARTERQAMRDHLRRVMRREFRGSDAGNGGQQTEAYKALDGMLAWVDGRRKRYDGKAGGLGK